MPDRSLILPVDDYRTGDFYVFGETVRSRFTKSMHLGDDIDVPAGTAIKSIGDGVVRLSEIREGSVDKRNWGGLILVEHQNFYAIYGHLDNLVVREGDSVSQGQVLGEVAEGLTPENGWWKNAHVHFGIYVGPWSDGKILPGYYRWWEFRTKKKWWKDPREFINNYKYE